MAQRSSTRKSTIAPEPPSPAGERLHWTLEQFIAEHQTRVDAFTRWWRENQKMHPAHFPVQMFYGDWDEQLHTFDPDAAVPASEFEAR